MSDVAALVTAISGAIVAILSAVGGLVVTLRRVSPKERADAVANATDTAQDERIAELREQLRALTEQQDGEEG
ncbi:hypothetical protein [Pseudonocardia sp. 73-21]|uniref:hypothetical protein n=1 Tax=Pseudonocardia sp. 73-21 TaxID=1895809 RepID=UPI000968D262|nr:hypothetical protein [Pseudonocardia sp. 73-21]OJY47586.1 MAG: hypothetical protein BGP03_33175 [Pseudonocardia sp. 73-21]